MRKVIDTSEQNIKRSIITFDSFADLLATNLEKDYRSKHMDDRDFYGVDNMREADALARKGLPHIGVEAIKLSKTNLALMQGDLYKPVFHEFFDVAGAYVDMGRYVEGTPECMVQFYPNEEPGEAKIVSLIMNISYNCMISATAIKKNGQALMALAEAIETAGKQTEVWSDMHVKGWDGKHVKARTAVRLKKAGEPFDVAMFMYALTHESYLRAHTFNAMHNHGADVRDACGIHNKGQYGIPITSADNMDDFPPYSVYIPCIRDNSQAGKFVPKVLKQLNLID